MLFAHKKFLKTSATLLLASVLSACGSLSNGVAKDGSHADTLVWPNPDSTTPLHKGGTYPNVSDLRLIHAGMDKRQIMDRIGAPHFSEGVFGVHEWNYLFNFHKHGSDEATQCQYKILFDDHQLARSFYWKPESCADLVNPPHHEMKKHEPMAAQTFTLSADALFIFNKSDAAHITPHGREELAALAQKIVDAGDGVASVQVTGYTDRIGSDAYNDGLSKRRADTVASELQQHGVPESKLIAQGRGKSAPVAECSEHKRAALIACLAPNRRVEVKVSGSK